MNRAEAATMTDEVAINLPGLDAQVQTDATQEIVKEVIKHVEVVREVHIREDQDKIDDIEIGIDE